MERTVKVTGRGRMTATPDLMIITLTQNKVLKTYEKAYSEASIAKKELDCSLEQIGVGGDLLKTTSFDINPEYKSYERNGEWTQRIIGYRYNHVMNIKIDLDMELLSRIYSALMKMKNAPSIDISYSIKDQESFKNELIAKAVKDSKTKAQALCDSLNVKLGEVLNIDYSWNDMPIYSRCNMKSRVFMDSEESMNMNPEDIELEDTVSVVWAIR